MFHLNKQQKRGISHEKFTFSCDTPLVMPKAKAQKLFLYTLAFKELCHSHALWMLHIQAKKIFIACENNIHIRHNIRILPSLSMTHFIYKRLNIILAGSPHRFGGPGKGRLRFSDGRSGGVADNDLPILILEEQDFIA